MTWRICRFELRRQLASPSTWGLALLFFALGFGAMQLLVGAVDSLRIVVMGTESLRFDSPFYLRMILGSLSFLLLPVTAWIFGSAIHQERAHRSGPLLWTTGVPKQSYWHGRFAAAFCLNIGLFLMIAAGIWLSTLMPWLEPGKFGAGTAAGYFYPFLTGIVPRTLLAGALVFWLVARMGSLLPGYLAMVALMAIYRLASRVAQDVESRIFAALLDPSGGVAASLVTQYWSSAEKNARLIPLEGWFLANRLLWTGVALAILILAGLVLRLDREREGRGSLRLLWPWQALRARTEAARDRVSAIWRRLPLAVKATFSEFVAVVGHPVFLATLAFGGVSMLAASESVGRMYGTATWPVTYAVAEVFGVLFRYFALGLLLFFCGHLVWKERRQRVAPLIDSSPGSIWLPLGSKWAALLAVAMMLQVFVLAAGALLQIHRGYDRHQWGLFATELLGRGFVDFGLFVTLCLAIQAFLSSRWLAYVVTVLIYAGSQSLPAIGLESVLLRFASDPGVIYSELNGYGHFGLGWASVKLFWALVAVLLLLGAGLLWPRGERAAWGERLEVARRRLGARVQSVGIVALFALPTVGGWVLFNTHHLNDFQSRDERELASVESERSFRSWLEKPQPRIFDVKAEVDLYPSRREAKAKVSYLLRPRGDHPIDAFLVRWPAGVDIESFELDRPFTVEERDRRSGYQVVRLERPLHAGQELRLEAETSRSWRGFANRQTGLGVVDNGTYLNSTSLFPGLGYDPASELTDPRRRHHHLLPARLPLPSRHDAAARFHPALGSDADRVGFEVVLSTEAGQHALAPGERLETWQEKDRRYTIFRTEVPVLNYFVFVSGDFEIERELMGEVELEIYYDPDHDYNIDTMMRAMKQSLELYSEAFGPYPHRSLRIVEFPRYRDFAISLPTLIPFSESMGFIARLEDGESIDYPFYVTAHEVAHQWWPHQVSPARTEGMAFLSESLAQYSALRVMQRQYGEARMGRFLRYELDRYLLGRGASQLPEMPLDRVQSGQPHLHYNKGALATWALANRLGFERMDAILAEYLATYKSAGEDDEPFPTTLEFLALVRGGSGPEHGPLITELFESITLYDLALLEASCEELAAGRFQVALEFEAARFQADGEGHLSEAPFLEPVVIGLFGEKRVLRKKVPISLKTESVAVRDGRQKFVIEVDSKPLRAAIDPHFSLVDRNPLDNSKDLQCQSFVPG